MADDNNAGKGEGTKRKKAEPAAGVIAAPKKKPEETTQKLEEDAGNKQSNDTSDVSEFIGRLIGIVVALSIPYYLLFWKPVSWSPAIKLLITGVALVAIVLLYVFAQAKTHAVFRTISNAVVVILLGVGSAMIAVFFASNEQTQIFKLYCVLFFSLLPAWLYLQFVYTKGRTIWDEYVVNLFRLRVDHYAHLPEPPRTSLFHKEWRIATEGEQLPEGVERRGIYRKKFEGHFGLVEPDKHITFASFRGENLWPVVGGNAAHLGRLGDGAWSPGRASRHGVRIWSMLALRRLPEGKKMAGGNR